MKRSHYTEERIAFALKQSELGTPVPGGMPQDGHLGRNLLRLAEEIRWLRPFGGETLKQLEEENNRMKKQLADLSLDKAMLQDVLSKKAE